MQATDRRTFVKQAAASATAKMEHGWATVHLPRLMHYASVKVVA